MCGVSNLKCVRLGLSEPPSRSASRCRRAPQPSTRRQARQLQGAGSASRARRWWTRAGVKPFQPGACPSLETQSPGGADHRACGAAQYPQTLQAQIGRTASLANRRARMGEMIVTAHAVILKARGDAAVSVQWQLCDSGQQRWARVGPLEGLSDNRQKLRIAILSIAPKAVKTLTGGLNDH